MTEVIMERFGSVRQKTVHNNKILLKDGWHFECKWIKCPGNDGKGICHSVILNDTIHTKYCFCG